MWEKLYTELCCQAGSTATNSDCIPSGYLSPIFAADLQQDSVLPLYNPCDTTWSLERRFACQVPSPTETSKDGWFLEYPSPSGFYAAQQTCALMAQTTMLNFSGETAYPMAPVDLDSTFYWVQLPNIASAPDAATDLMLPLLPPMQAPVDLDSTFYWAPVDLDSTFYWVQLPNIASAPDAATDLMLPLLPPMQAPVDLDSTFYWAPVDLVSTFYWVQLPDIDSASNAAIGQNCFVSFMEDGEMSSPSQASCNERYPFVCEQKGRQAPPVPSSTPPPPSRPPPSAPTTPRPPPPVTLPEAPLLPYYPYQPSNPPPSPPPATAVAFTTPPSTLASLPPPPLSTPATPSIISPSHLRPPTAPLGPEVGPPLKAPTSPTEAIPPQPIPPDDTNQHQPTPTDDTNRHQPSPPDDKAGIAAANPSPGNNNDSADDGGGGGNAAWVAGIIVPLLLIPAALILFFVYRESGARGTSGPEGNAAWDAGIMLLIPAALILFFVYRERKKRGYVPTKGDTAGAVLLSSGSTEARYQARGGALSEKGGPVQGRAESAAGYSSSVNAEDVEEVAVLQSTSSVTSKDLAKLAGLNSGMPDQLEPGTVVVSIGGGRSETVWTAPRRTKSSVMSNGRHGMTVNSSSSGGSAGVLQAGRALDCSEDQAPRSAKSSVLSNDPYGTTGSSSFSSGSAGILQAGRALDRSEAQAPCRTKSSVLSNNPHGTTGGSSFSSRSAGVPQAGRALDWIAGQEPASGGEGGPTGEGYAQAPPYEGGVSDVMNWNPMYASTLQDPYATMRSTLSSTDNYGQQHRRSTASSSQALAHSAAAVHLYRYCDISDALKYKPKHPAKVEATSQ
eukprot:gene27399-4696_t